MGRLNISGLKARDGSADQRASLRALHGEEAKSLVIATLYELRQAADDGEYHVEDISVDVRDYYCYTRTGIRLRLTATRNAWFAIEYEVEVGPIPEFRDSFVARLHDKRFIALAKETQERLDKTTPAAHVEDSGQEVS